MYVATYRFRGLGKEFAETIDLDEYRNVHLLLLFHMVHHVMSQTVHNLIQITACLVLYVWFILDMIAAVSYKHDVWFMMIANKTHMTNMWLYT